jgi:hypothetical protein
MEKLTSEQEDLIGDGAYEEKKIREEEEKEHKVIPINPDKFDEILIKIGRKKQNPNKEVKNNGNGKTKLL